MSVVTKTALRRALYGCMAGDTTLTNLLGAAADGYSKAIYFEQAPEGAAHPFVVFSKNSGTPTYAMRNGQPILKNELWLVKGVDRGSTADVVDVIASRIEALLTDGTLTISGGVQLYLRSDSDVDYSEVVSGTRYLHSGALFRLIHAPS